MASPVCVQMDLQVCNAKKTLMTAYPVRVQIMARAQTWCQITAVLVRRASAAITVKTVLTTAEKPTAASMASVSTLVQDSTATVQVDTLGNTASLKQVSVWKGLVTTMQPVMIWSTILLALVLTDLQAGYASAL